MEKNLKYKRPSTYLIILAGLIIGIGIISGVFASTLLAKSNNTYRLYPGDSLLFKNAKLTFNKADGDILVFTFYGVKTEKTFKVFFKPGEKLRLPNNAVITIISYNRIVKLTARATYPRPYIIVKVNEYTVMSNQTNTSCSPELIDKADDELPGIEILYAYIAWRLLEQYQEYPQYIDRAIKYLKLSFSSF